MDPVTTLNAFAKHSRWDARMLPSADFKFEAPWASRALRGSTDNGGFIVDYDFAEMNLAYIRSVFNHIYRTGLNQRKLRSRAIL